MIEAGVVIGPKGSVLHWHLPPGRSSVYLPDSRDLWDVLWENRQTVVGFAHTHPGGGIPGPSAEDLTTFFAVESALGRSLRWWIASSDSLIEIMMAVRMPGKKASAWEFLATEVPYEPPWLDQLRQHSYDLKKHTTVNDTVPTR